MVGRETLNLEIGVRPPDSQPGEEVIIFTKDMVFEAIKEADILKKFMDVNRIPCPECGESFQIQYTFDYQYKCRTCKHKWSCF